jgi:hypothetical protein
MVTRMYSLKEVNDVASLVSMCITEAVRTNNSNKKEWSDYVNRWCEAYNMPEDVYEHLMVIISGSIDDLIK